LAASTSRCADLVDPGRVNIFERWESQAALETFRSSSPDTEQRRAMLTVSVQEYDIADVRRTEPRSTDELRASVRS
jgi:quinol monooxygenase YgiN